MSYQRFRWNSAHGRLNKFSQQVPTISRCAKFCSRAREERPHVGIYTTKWTRSRRLFALWYEQLGRCAELLEANMEFARKKAWDLHKHMSKVKGIHVQACENSSNHRTEQLKRNLPLGQIANMKILIFVSSGASLHTVSKKNSLLAKKKNTRRPKEPTVSTTPSGKAESTEEATGVRLRLERLSQWCCRKIDSPSVLSLGLLREEMTTLDGKTGVSIVDFKVETVLWCKCENNVPLVTVSREPSHTRWHFEGVGRPVAKSKYQIIRRPVAFPKVSKHQKTGCTRFQGRFNLSNEASLVILTDSHNVVVEHPPVEQKETRPDDVRVRSEKAESTDLFFFRRMARQTKDNQGQLACTTQIHVFLKMRVEKSVSSQRQPKLRIRAAQKHGETEKHHIPCIPPTCNFFQFSGSLRCSRRTIIRDAYHFDITDVSAMAV